MNEQDFFKSPELLKSEIINIATPLMRDRYSIFPKWSKEGGADFISKKDLIICGSNSREEIRTLAKYFRVIAIVDDDL